MYRAFLSVFVTAAAIGIAANALNSMADERADGKAREDLTKWTDTELHKAIESSRPGSEDERQLSEVVRRGGDDWKKLLLDRNRAFSELLEHPDAAAERRRWDLCNLNLLTALRRVEGKPDPLRVLVAGKRKLTRSLHHKLEFSALVVNLDIEKKTLHGLTRGGNDRSGRLERWRFEIRDEKGEALPCIQQFGFMGGGIFSMQDLESDESWQTELLLRKYVLVSKPGKYKMRPHYHNNAVIARSESIDGLITAQSDEIELEVTPINVSVTEKEREQARKWIARLPEEGPVKILMDGVIESPKHLDPTSPPGELQRMYTDAIPDLIDAALDPDLTPGKRAWVLGLLTGITGHNNPCDGLFDGAEILGDYEYESSGASGSGGGKISPTKQKGFAEKWRVWKTDRYFKIEKPAGE